MEARSAKRKRIRRTELIDWSFLNDAAGAADADHISELPDDVIHRILGFLPLPTIAKTSLLSRRWAQIWHSFPDLDFTTVRTSEDNLTRLVGLFPKESRRLRHEAKVGNLLLLDDPDGDIEERNFISKVLSLHRKKSDLRALRIRAHASLTCLNSIIRRALTLGVCELDVEFSISSNGSFTMPKRVFSSGSLRVLRFQTQLGAEGFRLPSLDALKCGSRSLQVLALSGVNLEKHSCLTSVFTDSSFPALKKLSLASCYGLKQIDIRCSGLEEVTLKKCNGLKMLEVDGPRLEKLMAEDCFHIASMKGTVKVDAPRLRVVQWIHNYGVTGKAPFRNSTAVNEAIVDFREGDDATSFLLGLSHAGLRCLKLETRYLHILAGSGFGALVPFDNLGCLELGTFLSKRVRPALSLVLACCPSLHTFTLTIFSDNGNERNLIQRVLWKGPCSEEEKYWETQKHAMKSFLQHLRVVKIYRFLEYEDEVSLVKFMLKHGEALQEVKLLHGGSFIQGGGESKLREEIRSQIMRFSKASPSAKVSF